MPCACYLAYTDFSFGFQLGLQFQQADINYSASEKVPEAVLTTLKRHSKCPFTLCKRCLFHVKDDIFVYARKDRHTIVLPTR